MATWVGARAGAEVIDLDEPAAVDGSRTGTKAANLAKARSAGLPTLGGFVIPAGVTAAIAEVGLPASVEEAYAALSAGGAAPVVVRSSAAAEDTAESSQAGRFTSVVEVVGADAFVAAVRAVIASGDGGPMAVLVQPHLDPAAAGVAFGIDPVSGRVDGLTVAAVRGGPQALVGGAVSGDRYELGRLGRLRRADRVDGGTDLGRRDRWRLARLAARAASVFGGPQDIEWALTDAGHVVLLQSRPVTAAGAPVTGPEYGRGPLAETFAAPLARLEQDLWLAPLRTALVEVAVLTGRAPRRALERRRLVVAPGGRAAVDLEVFGEARPRTWAAAVDPRPRLRRLAAAWRVGRLTAAHAGVIADLVADADAALEAVPELATLGDDELLRILERADAALVALHGHEILAGALRGGGDDDGPTGVEVALHSLRAAPGATTDAQLRSAHPVVLALSSPRIGTAAPLPRDAPAVRAVGVDDLRGREALRLRVRWVQELTARVAIELGRRLVARGGLAAAEDIRHLPRRWLPDALAGAPIVLEPVEEGPPLPPVFRFATDGAVVDSSAGTEAVGAGGGRRAGPVHHGDDPPAGSVLVVDVLDPALAVWLPRLAALVAETGSPLSHLAILAREHGVATVVGMAGATRRWQDGEVVVVDGTTGSVAALQDLEQTS